MTTHQHHTDSELSRRSFIASAALSASAFAVSPLVASTMPNQSRQSNTSKRILKSLKYGMIAEGETVLDKFKLAQDAGFDGVELDAPADYWTLDKVKDAIDKTNLTVPGVVLSSHWHKPFNHPDDAVRKDARNALERAIKACKALGGTSVLVVPAVVNKDMSYTDAYTRSQEEIKRFVPLAEELEIDIAFENVWNNFLLSPIEASRYVDEFESKRVGWYFDIGNIVNYAYPEHWIDALGNRIKKLDVKDFSRQKRNDEGLWKGFSVNIGEGDSDWDRVCAALDRINYSGWASAEVGGGGPDRLKDIAQRMDKVFAPLT